MYLTQVCTSLKQNVERELMRRSLDFCNGAHSEVKKRPTAWSPAEQVFAPQIFSYVTADRLVAASQLAGEWPGPDAERPVHHSAPRPAGARKRRIAGRRQVRSCDL